MRVKFDERVEEIPGVGRASRTTHCIVERSSAAWAIPCTRSAFDHSCDQFRDMGVALSELAEHVVGEWHVSAEALDGLTVLNERISALPAVHSST